MENGRGWEEFLLPYKQAVDELKMKFRGIRGELKQLDKYSPVEFVTGRVKEVSSILSKSKRLDLPLGQLEEMEDIAGIRIMCQFVPDIDHLVRLIHERNDMEIISEKDYVSNQKESGYRSYHIIIRYPVYTSMGEQKVLAEIQIRTLAMNFWATIEHSLNYKYEHNIPEGIKARLRKAAEAAFMLDQEMSEIRKEITEAQQLFEDKSILVTKVLQDIEEMYLAGFVIEANKFQKQFNAIKGQGDVRKLRKLSQTIQNARKRLEERSS